MSFLFFCGCAGEHATRAAEQANARAAALPAPELPARPRLQQGENDHSKSTVQRTNLESAHESFPGLPDGRVAVRIRARVNGIAIFDEEVREACLFDLQRASSPEEQKAVVEHALQALIDREVLLQDLDAHAARIRPQYLTKLKEAAAKEFAKQVNTMKANAKKAGVKIETDLDLKKALAAQGLSLEAMRRKSERDFMAREYMLGQIYSRVSRVGHQEIVDYYRQHPNQFQVEDSVQWQDIFVDAGKFRSRDDARRLAEQVVSRAQSGEDFAKLAAQYDNGLGVDRNAEGYGQRRGEIQPPEAEPILFQLKDGQIGPVIELANGFHVVRLIKREYAGMKPLDDKTQNEIRKKLQSAAAERESKRLLTELRRKSTIEIVKDDS